MLELLICKLKVVYRANLSGEFLVGILRLVDKVKLFGIRVGRNPSSAIELRNLWELWQLIKKAVTHICVDYAMETLK